MASKLPILLFLLFAVIVFLSVTFYSERKRARSEEIKKIIQEAEQSLDQSRMNSQYKKSI